MLSVELFAGCGGLAFGIAEAGFKHAMVIESDPHASGTLRLNKDRGTRHFDRWPILSKDVCAVDYAPLADAIDLVSGGPPCQPFSIGGKHKGPTDGRNMWPQAIRAVQELRPRAFLFENVRGLLRPAFVRYLEFLRLQLSWPDIASPGGGWVDHARRLARHERSGAAPTYRVLIQGINAADYGAAQKRHRAIVLGVRSSLVEDLAFPAPTHSRAALLWSQRITGDYWEGHGISRRSRPPLSNSDRYVVERLRTSDVAPVGLPWVTVRDAIGDLPRPTTRAEEVRNHVLHPGARVYERHTGSCWDEPAKALKAGDHGVPGGENILVSSGGAVRYFTIREMARLQGLPDDFVIEGTWKAPVKQLGNAVPVAVGRAFGHVIREHITGAIVGTRRRAA